MSVSHALLASTVNILDKQMPQGLAEKDSYAEVVPNSMHQMMVTMDFAHLGITVKRVQQTVPCAQRVPLGLIMELHLAVTVYHALVVNTVSNRDFVWLPVTALRAITAQLKRIFVHRTLVASNAPGDIFVQMVLLTRSVATQGLTKEGYARLHVISARRVITVQPTPLIHYLVQHIITVQMEPILRLSVLMEHSLIAVCPSLEVQITAANAMLGTIANLVLSQVNVPLDTSVRVEAPHQLQVT